ncbi:MAG: glycosyltransferase family 4 protein [Candidatus Cyclonatronum sp.]|uniref:glycosyltransferase family 4 protein n=1 Tax=Cyclonatronum sp. TaxID=3024185 RepID=UPI0025BFB329|nr:glycosyltransferase family 4 protein [Cyclonatronum sp.]MCH8486075.1 glycosyltransferase family 4 protein [Cyclonatronum sp.]
MLKNIGGMQRVSLQLTNELAANAGIELKEITMETGWRFIGVKTFLFLLRLFLFLPARVKRDKPDIILFSSMVTGTLGYFLRRRIRVPMVSISHGHDVTLSVGIYQWLLRKVFACLDGVISVSSATRDECIRRGLEESKSQVLPNGFDVRDLPEAVNKTQARQQLEQALGIQAGNRRILLTVGRLIKRKGHEWFIREILPKLETDVLYVIIGDGNEAAAIRRAIQESGQSAKVHFDGRQEDEVLKVAYSAADLFIMPNIRVPGDMEGFGVVLLEANIRCTPAIASDIEGIRDVIEQGVNGYRIPELDAGAFAQTIDRVMAEELDQLSVRAREYVQSRFSWEAVSKAYIKHLSKFVYTGERS